MKVIECESAPADSLTEKDRKQGALTDCFCIDLPRSATLEKYIFAFYTTGLFKAERAILSAVVRKPSTDEEALLLSQDKANSFSAWTVEHRSANQVLLRDFRGDTKSWLMVQPITTDSKTFSRLYFGTVVVPKKVSKDGQKSVSYAFYLFGGLHRLYSRALLRAAYKKLVAGSKS